MPLVYTSYDPVALHNLRNLLEMAGIECRVKNEHLGGGAGELPINEVWGELWVSEEDEAQALDLIAQLAQEAMRPAWVCTYCGERNEGSFDLCWRCGKSL